METGWSCPNCGSAHGPHVNTCPVPPKIPTGVYPKKPQDIRDLDLWKRAATNPCAHCIGPCANVACPNRVVVTFSC